MGAGFGQVAPGLRHPLLRLRIPPLTRRPVIALVRAAFTVLPGRAVRGVTVSTARVPGGPRLRIYQAEALPGGPRPGEAQQGGPRSGGALPGGAGVGGALLWMHGGGLVVGRPRLDDPTCSEVAREAGLLVVSVDYRRAPEWPFPAGLEDCLAAWGWLAARVEPGRIFVGGQSAGGGLAAALAQRLYDRGARPAGQLLHCPMLDDRTVGGNHYPIWGGAANRSAWRHYLPDGPAAYGVPARRAEVGGLPPAWIGVGDLDLFFGEAAAYAGRLRAAGVPVDLRVVPGAPHAFERLAWKSPISRAHRLAACEWLTGR